MLSTQNALNYLIEKKRRLLGRYDELADLLDLELISKETFLLRTLANDHDFESLEARYQNVLKGQPLMITKLYRCNESDFKKVAFISLNPETREAQIVHLEGDRTGLIEIVSEDLLGEDSNIPHTPSYNPHAEVRRSFDIQDFRRALSAERARSKGRPRGRSKKTSHRVTKRSPLPVDRQSLFDQLVANDAFMTSLDEELKKKGF